MSRSIRIHPSGLSSSVHMHILYRCQATERKFQPVAVLVLKHEFLSCFRVVVSLEIPPLQIHVTLSYLILSDVLAELVRSRYFVVGVCILLRVLSNYKIKPSLATTDKMYLFCVLFDHDMFRPSQVAIFR
jgi:hypothetical protein